jgi:hypothetical protein
MRHRANGRATAFGLLVALCATPLMMQQGTILHAQSLGPGSPGIGAPVPQCRVEWQPLRLGDSARSIRYAEAAALTPFRGGVALIGSPAFDMKVDSSGNLDPVAMLAGFWTGVASHEVVNIPLPAANDSLFEPVVARRSNTTLHVVYASRPAQRADTSALTLLHRTLGAQGWSKVDTVAQSQGLLWNNRSVSLIADGDDLTLVVPSFNGSGTLAVRRRNGVWTTSRLSGTHMSYARVARTGVSELVLVAAGIADHLRQTGENQLFTMESSDDGRHWTQPMRLGAHEVDMIQDLALATVGGRLVAVAVQRRPTPGVAVLRIGQRRRAAEWEVSTPYSVGDGWGEIAVAGLGQRLIIAGRAMSGAIEFVRWSSAGLRRMYATSEVSSAMRPVLGVSEEYLLLAATQVVPVRGNDIPRTVLYRAPYSRPMSAKCGR